VDYFIDDFTNPLYFNNIKVEMIETPGHTKGSICLRLGNCLLTGDTIFEKDVGRVDLPGGNKEQLIKSLRIITALPTSLKLYPGHGNSTTLGDIMKKNKKLMALL
jgi:glyoxylase-like metal-dependent hydrolase (beta-lactamase superfamily II)